MLGVNPWYGAVHNPLHPGKTTGGSSAGNAAALAAGLVDLGLGTDTGCSIRLPSAACGTVGLKPRWGHLPIDGVFPLVPTLDTVGPMGRTVEDVALLWSVLSGLAVPEPRLEGLTVGLLRRAPEIGDGRETESSDAADAWVADLERLGARVVESRGAGGPRRHVAAVPPRGRRRAIATTFPVARGRVRPGDPAEARVGPPRRSPTPSRPPTRRCTTGARYEPDVDLYVSPCIGIDLPAEDADENEVRLPLSSFLRWVNLIGWAGLAVGNMQFVAPTDEIVLAAGLAWERR